MTPLFLGNPGRDLLGVWSRPSGRVDRDHGVLLCPPIGQEHVRTHWALRQAAISLSHAGFHCLRFDWFGVGDSAGDLGEATLIRWQADLLSAAQELRSIAGVQQISLVGLRVGGLLAALGAPALQPRAIVLWDPVVSGRSYVAGLARLTHSLAADPDRYWNLNPARRRPRIGELVGFDFGARLTGELEQVDLGGGEAIPPVPMCLLRSTHDHDLETFARRMQASNRRVLVRDTALRVSWTSPDDVERLVLPGDAIREITQFLERPAA